jgi:hypothetical protein
MSDKYDSYDSAMERDLDTETFTEHETPSGAVVVEMGYERDRLNMARGSLDVRWWLYIFIPGEKLRPSAPRLGVVDRGFRFARGGRASEATDAEHQIAHAYDLARQEAAYWRGQPSHGLGSAGELIPLDEVLPELTP